MEKVKDVLITALEKELQAHGEDIVRTYLIDNLVDNLIKIVGEERNGM